MIFKINIVVVFVIVIQSVDYLIAVYYVCVFVRIFINKRLKKCFINFKPVRFLKKSTGYVSRLFDCLSPRWGRRRFSSTLWLRCHFIVTLLWTGFFGEYLIKGVRLIFVISGKLTLTVNNKVRGRHYQRDWLPNSSCLSINTEFTWTLWYDQWRTAP